MTGVEIAERVAMAVSAVQGVPTRIGLGERSRREPPEPSNRYERARPGELIHIDVKKLGRIGPTGPTGPGYRVTDHRRGDRSRGAGWDYVHVGATTSSGIAYVEVRRSNWVPWAA